jgi:hypothetical protein
MAFSKYYDVPEPVTTPPCIHLRSKAIYVTGDLKDPNHPDEAGSQYCWCNITQHILGPDEKSCDQRRCTPDRPCYRDAY